MTHSKRPMLLGLAFEVQTGSPDRAWPKPNAATARKTTFQAVNLGAAAESLSKGAALPTAGCRACLAAQRRASSADEDFPGTCAPIPGMDETEAKEEALELSWGRMDVEDVCGKEQVSDRGGGGGGGEGRTRCTTRNAPAPSVHAELVVFDRGPGGLPASFAVAGQFPPQLELEGVQRVHQQVSLPTQGHRERHQVVVPLAVVRHLRR